MPRRRSRNSFQNEQLIVKTGDANHAGLRRASPLNFVMTATPNICISICESTLAGVHRALGAASTRDAMAEVRLDYLDDSALANVKELRKVLESATKSTIITLRPADEGGARAIDYETRWRFWIGAGLQLPASFADIELDIAERLLADRVPVDWSHIICSYHNFDEVPADLENKFNRLLAVPARVIKLATMATDVVDCLPIFHLIDKARNAGREIIAIAMGPAGVATRVLGPARGAFLTYASTNDVRATAPGQPSCDDLKNLYHIQSLDSETLVTGVVGFPVGHSLSPEIHNAAFQAHELNAVYLPLEVQNLSAFFTRMVHPRTRELDWPVRGLSITAPHKTRALTRVDWVDPEAREIGAINTVVVEKDRLCGYNTDAMAFSEPLRGRIGRLKNARVAIVGAGGAAAAALFSLKREQANVVIFARDLNKAQRVANRWQVEYTQLAGADFRSFDVVVNATPLGTKGKLGDQSPVCASQLRGARLAYDLVYNPGVTEFLCEAEAAGCATLNGLPMFIAQAAQQFRLWTGIHPDRLVMRRAAEKALSPASNI